MATPVCGRSMDRGTEGPGRRPHDRLGHGPPAYRGLPPPGNKATFQEGSGRSRIFRTWRGCRWRIDGSFLVMSERAWELVATQQKNVEGTSWLVQASTMAGDTGTCS